MASKEDPEKIAAIIEAEIIFRASLFGVKPQELAQLELAFSFGLNSRFIRTQFNWLAVALGVADSIGEEKAIKILQSSVDCKIPKDAEFVDMLGKLPEIGKEISREKA